MNTHILPLPFMQKKRSTLFAEANVGLLLTTFVLAGSTYNPFAKILTEALTPLSLLVFSEVLNLFFTIASFGLLPIVRQLLAVNRQTFFALLGVGLLSGTLAPILWFWGLHSTSAVNASLFGNTEMLFLMILAFIFLHEKWTRIHLFASIAVLFGILMITLQGFSHGITFQKGDLIIILASLCFGCGSMLYRLFLHETGIHVALFMRSTMAISIFFLLSPFVETQLIDEVRAFPLTLIPALLGFGFLSRFLNVFTFYIALERVKVSIVSLLGALQVIGGAIFAHLYLGEALLWYHYAGGALIIFGTLLIELRGFFSHEHLRIHLKQRHHHRI